MILDEEMVPVGKTQKTHGRGGEIVILFYNSLYAEIDANHYFFKIDGINVPFFVERSVAGSDRFARLKFEDLDDETEAAKYVNLEVSLPEAMMGELLTDIDSDLHFFIGWSVIDKRQGELIGTITDVDDSTINTLFLLSNGKREILIPAADDFFVKIDRRKRTIYMQLPEGLINC